MGEEADDQPAGGWKTEEAAGMDVEALVEEANGGFFVACGGGDTKDGVPAALDGEAADPAVVRRLGGELEVEFREVRAGAVEDLHLEGAAGDEPGWQGGLDWGVHG